MAWAALSASLISKLCSVLSTVYSSSASLLEMILNSRVLYFLSALHSFGVVIFRSLQLRMTLYALSLRRSSRAPHIASARKSPRQDLASVNSAQVTSPGRARKTKAAIVMGSSPQSRDPRPLVGVRARGHLRRRGLFPLHCTLWMRAFPLPCKPSLSIRGVQAA